ncbi:MAG TPA: hypothetical protein VL947_08430 [Cytophagales bacterium]|nr:hypothetical protein [Cytophagales bacterium]
MKHLKFYSLLFFCVQFLAYASKDSTLLLLQTDGRTVKAKWIPLGSETYVSHYEAGYHLVRYDVVKNADGSLSRSNKVQLSQVPIVPVRLNEVPNGDAQTLKDVQFGLDFKENFLKEPQSFKEAAMKPNGVNYMYIFNLYYLLSSNKSAKNLGVFYEDQSISAGRTYLYVIQDPKSGKVMGSQLIDASKPTPVFKPYNLSHKQTAKEVYIRWVEDSYFGTISYNLYRSESLNGKYTKVNKAAITTISSVGYSNFIDYTDTVDSYNKTYYYKATSINFFEQESAMSAPLEVRSLRYLQQAPYITQGLNLNKTEIELKWIMDTEDQPYVKQYAVYKSHMAEGKYKKISNKPISSNTFTFKDAKVEGSSNYYRVCAYGQGGDSLCSLLKGVFLVDSVPPAKAVMTYGVCDTNYIVTIKWKKSQESDFLGYRVFKTYNTKQEPIRMTRGHIYDTVFVDTLPKKISDKVVYYAVSAIDFHFNPSALGNYIAVRIPDKIRPAAPQIKNYNVDARGIYLDWEPGLDKDLYKITLYRKSRFDFGYIEQAHFKGDSLHIHHYSDTLTKSNETYFYKLVAEDSSGLRSDERPGVGIKQMDKFVPHKVENLQALVSRPNKMLKLTWEFKGNAKSFKIFRSQGGKVLETYDFVSGSMREYYDKTLSPNTEYSYQVQATYYDHKSSYLSPIVKIKY